MSRILTPEAATATVEELNQPFREIFNPQKVAEELALIAFSDIQDYLQVDTEGSVKPRGFDEIEIGKTRVIKKVREKRRILNGKQDDTILEDTFEFELYDKLKALEMGARFSGLEPSQKIEHSGTINIAAEVVDAWAKIKREKEGEK